MWIVRNYILQGVEYMVCDGQSGYVPGMAGMELLADRCQGVGADRILLLDEPGAEPLQAFEADGSSAVLQPEDFCVADCARAADIGSEVSMSFEAHVTAAFCRRMAACDQKSSALAS